MRMAVLDEMEFRRQLWDHRPLTDFWRIGHGTARRLEKNGIFTLFNKQSCRFLTFFINFASMQCVHDEQSALHLSANDPNSQ